MKTLLLGILALLILGLAAAQLPSPPAGAQVGANPRTVAVEPPAAPEDLRARAVAGNAIALDWTDRSFDETGFEVERAAQDADFSGIALLDMDTETFLDVGLKPGEYRYRVRAVNEFGPSEWTDVATAEVAVPLAGYAVVDTLTTWSVVGGRPGARQDAFRPGETVGIVAVVRDQRAEPLAGADVAVEILDAAGVPIARVRGTTAVDGAATLLWELHAGAPLGDHTARVTDVTATGNPFEASRSTTEVLFVVR